jgi:hypothetical protein
MEGNSTVLRPRGTVLSESTQIHWFSDQSGGRLDLEKKRRRPRALKAKLGLTLSAEPHLRFQSFHENWIFLCKYFVTGEDSKALFSIPGDTVT